MTLPLGASRRIAINAQLISTSHSYRSAGISHYLFSLLREIKALEPPEEILVYLGAGALPTELAPAQRFRPIPSRLPTHRPLTRIAWEQLVLPRLLQRERVDLLHVGTHALPLAWPGPTVLTIYDLSFMLFPAVFRRANRAYLTWMVHQAARRAERVFAISDSTANDVHRLLGVPADRIVRVYGGVDTRFGPIEDEEVLADFRRSHGLPERFSLYLGTIEPRKNLVRLIDAHARLGQSGTRDCPLVLAGAPGPGHQAIEAHAAQVGLGDSIRFTGYVPESEKPLWYNAARLFVYPSLYEGFGLPVLEALACGTPVVAADRSSLPEVVGDAGMLVNPESVEQIAEAMQQVLEDERLRERLAMQGPRQASQFSWRRAAEETLSTYRAVLDSL